MIVILRHCPKLGTSQGDAYTEDELLLWWRWCITDQLTDLLRQVLNIISENAD
jgi:hypothetical protein